MDDSSSSNHLDSLISARKSLNLVLEKSRILSSSIDATGQKISEIAQRLPYLEAAVRPIRAQREALGAVGGHINRAVSPASAVLKVFDAVHGLEKSLLSDPQNDLSGYFSVLKRLQEAVIFLGENCGLAIQWLQDIVEYLQDNLVADDRFISALNRSLQTLRESDVTEMKDNLDGGLLEAALNKLDFEFCRLVSDNTVPLPMPSSLPGRSHIAASPLPTTIIQKLQAIITRMAANNRLEKCLSSYAQIRGLNVRSSLAALGLDYLNTCRPELIDVQNMEVDISRWREHLEFAVKHLFEAEYRLCNEVFERTGTTVVGVVWAGVASNAGILAFLEFGRKVTESRKDPIKLLKLLDVFKSLHSLRVDFNRLFGGACCADIQNFTRDLVRRVVDGACEIFGELLLQVELQRQSPPPADGGVPKLVSFITDYSDRLVGDEYRPILTQVLVIHRSWRREEGSEEHVVARCVLEIVKAVEVNLEVWAKGYENVTLSHFFLMNNHWHMYRGLKGTRLGRVLGEPWLQEHEQCGEFYAARYMRESWGQLPGRLSREGLLTWSGGRATARELVKTRLKQFNEAVEGMLAEQAGWVVAEREERERICRRIVQVVVPVYRSFMQNYGELVGEQGGKYVKFTVHELERKLSSMFYNKHAYSKTSGSFRLKQGSPKTGNGVPPPSASAV